MHQGELIRQWQPLININLHSLCPPRGIWLGDLVDAWDDTAPRGVKMRNVRTWISA